MSGIPTEVVDKVKVHVVAGIHFMAALLEQIYLDDVSGSEPVFPFKDHSPWASAVPAEPIEQQCVL